MEKSRADKRYEDLIDLLLEIEDKLSLLEKLIRETVELYIEEGVENDKR